MFLFPDHTATATGTQAAGSVTTITLTNIGAGYTRIHRWRWNKYYCKYINWFVIKLYYYYCNTTSPFFTTAPTILISGGGEATQTTTCTINAGTGFINTIALPVEV